MLAVSSSFLSGIFDGIKNIIKIVGNIGNILTGFFQSIIGIIYSIFYYLFMSVCQISTFAEMLFKKFAGIDTMVTNDGSVKDIVTIFISSNEVWGLFVSIIVLSIILLFLFTFIAIIKSEFSLDVKGSAKGPIIARALKSLAMFIVVPTVSVMGIYAVNALTQTINGMFRNGNEVSISNQIFYVSAYNANRARQDSDNFKTYITGGTVKGLLGDEYKLDSNTKNRDGGTFNNPDTVAYEIDIAFRGNRKASGDNWVTLDPLSAIDANISVDSMLTQYTIYLSDYFSPWNVGTVSYYYRLADFDYLLGLATSIYMALMLVFMSATLIKRVFEITILLLLAPPLISMAPLDGGSASKKWQGEFIKRVIAIIGPVFAINMYFVLVPVFMSITLFSGGLNIGGVTASAGMPSTVSAINISTIAASPVQALIPGYQLYDSIFQLLTLCVGMQVVKQASALLSNLLGIGDLVKEGADAAKKAATTAVSVAAAAATGGAAFAAKSVASKKLTEAESGLTSAQDAVKQAEALPDSDANKAQRVAAAKAKLQEAEDKRDEAKENFKGREKEAREAKYGLIKTGTSAFGLNIGAESLVKAVDDGKKNIKDAREGEGAGTELKKTKKKEARALRMNALADKNRATANSANVGIDALDEHVLASTAAAATAESNENRFNQIMAKTDMRTWTKEERQFMAGLGIRNSADKNNTARVSSIRDSLHQTTLDAQQTRDQANEIKGIVDSNVTRDSSGNVISGAAATKAEIDINAEKVTAGAGNLTAEQIELLSSIGEAKTKQMESENARRTGVNSKIQEISEEEEARARLENKHSGAEDVVEAALDRNALGDAVQQGIEESISRLKSAITEAIRSSKLDVKGLDKIKSSIIKQQQAAEKAKREGKSDNEVGQILKDGLDSIRDSLKKD